MYKKNKKQVYGLQEREYFLFVWTVWC